LVYFITYEAVTFVGLIMYRLCPANRATRPIIVAGMLIFGLSRPVQIVWILTSLAVSWEHLVVWHAECQIILAFVFTALQLYSLNIHYSLYKKCESNIRLQDENEMVGIKDEEEEETTGWICKTTDSDAYWVGVVEDELCNEETEKEIMDEFSEHPC
jgi:hypothetical protein